MKRRSRTLFLTVMCISVGIISSGQAKTENPFGLVYQGAITENVSGKVNIHPVNDKLNGNDISANVYRPFNCDPSKYYSCSAGPRIFKLIMSRNMCCWR